MTYTIRLPGNIKMHIPILPNIVIGTVLVAGTAYYANEHGWPATLNQIAHAYAQQDTTPAPTRNKKKSTTQHTAQQKSTNTPQHHTVPKPKPYQQPITTAPTVTTPPPRATAPPALAQPNPLEQLIQRAAVNAPCSLRPAIPQDQYVLGTDNHHLDEPTNTITQVGTCQNGDMFTVFNGKYSSTIRKDPGSDIYLQYHIDDQGSIIGTKDEFRITDGKREALSSETSTPTGDVIEYQTLYLMQVIHKKTPVMIKGKHHTEEYDTLEQVQAMTVPTKGKNLYYAISKETRYAGQNQRPGADGYQHFGNDAYEREGTGFVIDKKGQYSAPLIYTRDNKFERDFEKKHHGKENAVYNAFPKDLRK